MIRLSESTQDKAVYRIDGEEETVFTNLLLGLKYREENIAVELIEIQCLKSRVARPITTADLYIPDPVFLLFALSAAEFERTGETPDGYAVFQAIVRDKFVGSRLVVEPTWPNS